MTDIDSFPNPHRATSLGAIRFLEWLEANGWTIYSYEKAAMYSRNALAYYVHRPRNGSPMPQRERPSLERNCGIPQGDWDIFTKYMPAPKVKSTHTRQSVAWRKQCNDKLQHIADLVEQLSQKVERIEKAAHNRGV